MEKTIVEYIWLDGYGGLRSKIRVLEGRELVLTDIPGWNYDGSSTRQGTIENSELILQPVALYHNPFHQGGYLVMCDVYALDESGKRYPHISNIRASVLAKFEATATANPWFGIEQEYYILEKGTDKPYLNENKKQHGKYYCGCAGDLQGREFADAHLKACLQAGLKISGINAEVGPSQWEYQIGPVEGIEAADQLWVSRYLLQRLAEKAGVDVSLHPKPIGEEWPGSGCHVNFSTKQMRMDGGYPVIKKCLEELKKGHHEYVKWCGDDTHKRLTGDHETGMIQSFSWGIGSRNVSVRIPKDTHFNECGYFEDR